MARKKSVRCDLDDLHEWVNRKRPGVLSMMQARARTDESGTTTWREPTDAVWTLGVTAYYLMEHGALIDAGETLDAILALCESLARKQEESDC